MVAELDFKFDAGPLIKGLVRSEPTLARGMRRGMLDAVSSSHRKEGFRHHLRTTLPKQYRWVSRRLRTKVSPRSSRIDNLELALTPRARAISGLEFGGVQRPKRARFLAIPIQQGLTPGGRRKKALQVARGQSLRSLGKDFIVIRGADGDLLLYGKTPKGRRQRRPSFVLKRQVRQKPVLGLIKRWESFADNAGRIVNGAIRKALEGITRGKR